MSYKLYLDDERCPPDDGFVVVRSTTEAIAYVKEHGWPTFMSLDHDLGGDDTTMTFLRRLAAELWDQKTPPPDYHVHSANPVGKLNIISFMETWQRISHQA